MSAELVCWQCGSSLKDQPLPFGRRAECRACGAALHVCRQCRHFDAGKAKQCRERAADEIKEKARANFCDWFQPKAGAYNASASNPPNPLNSLFGADASAKPPADPLSELNKLFGKD